MPGCGISRFQARFVSRFPKSKALRPAKRPLRYCRSETTSMEPFPLYQNDSASKRALVNDHSFSLAEPAVPYTNTTRLPIICLKGPACATLESLEGSHRPCFT